MHDEFIGRGWSFPLGVDHSGRVAMVTGSTQLEQAMHLILATSPGERPMRPEFGCPLRDYIFGGANGEAAAGIRADVRLALERWEPRIDVGDINVTVGPQENVLYIDIQYAPSRTNEWRNLVFPFYTIPEEEEE